MAYSVIAKDNSGNLYAWGRNNVGQLGIGNKENQLSPVQILGISNIVEVYRPYNSVIAKDNNGNLYAWGWNYYGQLGIGNKENQLSPVQIQGLSDIADVYGNGGTSVIVKDNSGNLYAWGSNGSGQLGIGNTKDQSSPVPITGLSNIANVYMDSGSVIARDNSGNLYAWGSNSIDQLGIGNTNEQISPILIKYSIYNKKVDNFEIFGNINDETVGLYIVANDGSCYLHTYSIAVGK